MQEHTGNQQAVSAAPAEAPAQAPGPTPPPGQAPVEGPAGAPPGWAHPGWVPPHGQWGPPPKRPRGRFERLGNRLYGLVNRPAWLAPLAILTCLSAAFTYVLAFDPTDGNKDALGPCAFKMATGLDCPGCGGTRMVWYLLHLNIPEAARHHVMALIAAPVLAYAFVAWTANRLTRWRLPVWTPSGRVLAVYGIGWLVFVVARNLPWEPFTYFFV